MPRGPQPGQPLSPRDLETLQGLADGLSNQQLSRRLFIAQDSAKTRCAVLFRKLGVCSRAAAVAVGYERGLIVAPPRRPRDSDLQLVAAHLLCYRSRSLTPDPRSMLAAAGLLEELAAAGWRGPADA
jgi:DNA-binding CsgD family transcriptional regulator